MKTKYSFRLDDETNELLQRMADYHGFTRTAIVQYAIRDMARQGAFKLPSKSDRRSNNKAE